MIAEGQLAEQLTSTEWTDWRWQQKNAIRSVAELLKVFPDLSDADCQAIRSNLATRRFQMTPYYASLIRRNVGGNAPLSDDPLWREVAPTWLEQPANDRFSYDGETENWELPAEMATPIAQHKYDDRVIVRLANVCHAYCQFCYEALRTLEKDSLKASFQQKYWDDTIAYIRTTPAVEEVILSGGEPLMHTDEQLGRVLADLRGIGRPLAIRIHTRALTFNPFRITDGVVEVMREYGINAIGLHVTHPNELTPDFKRAVERLRAATPILFANIPLLRGINDDATIIHALGMRLYLLGVARGYLYHFMPHSPGSATFRTPVQTGVDIIRSLKRRVSNLAVPEFVLPHHSGKYTMPLLAQGEAPPVWENDTNGYRVVRFTNWRGELVDYPDAQ